MSLMFFCDFIRFDHSLIRKYNAAMTTLPIVSGIDYNSIYIEQTYFTNVRKALMKLIFNPGNDDLGKN